MSISSVSSLLGAQPLGGPSPSAGQNKPTSALQSDLQQIREKGLRAWAHDQKMEKLKEKLRDQVLSEKKITEDGLAAMPSAQRSAIEGDIEKLIAEKLEEVMKGEVEKAAKEGKSQAVLLDILV
ncbi:hypothetical protein [Brevundimonas sp.]|uniref:hypothetical protein n=1 Tax=Brevundimonas sp. TaxID=1871086 RepID=UPI0025BF2E51|nr:hypothetical protein [Brevundimonas sp.]